MNNHGEFWKVWIRKMLFVIPIIFVVMGLTVKTYAHDSIKLKDGTMGQKYSDAIEGQKKKNENYWIAKPDADVPKGLKVLPEGYLIGIPQAEGSHKFEVWVWKDNNTEEKPVSMYEIKITILPDPTKEKILDFGSTENLRILGGYEFSRASSTAGAQKGFFDVYFSQPLPLWKKGNKWRKRLKMSPIRAWGNIRLTTVPQEDEKTIGALGPEYFGELASLKFNQIAQSAEFFIGLDIALWKLKSKEEERHYILGIVLAAGAITPTTTTRDDGRIFKISTRFKEQHPEIDFSVEGAPEYVSFVPKERNRFYRQYYVGLRFKSYYSGFNKGKVTFPTMFDATWGLNDAASGGKGHFFNKSVFRFEGFLPFRIYNFPLYLFGTAVINTSKEKTTLPLILDPATDEDNVSPTSPNLLIIPVPENDKDYFRIGMGIDLSFILKKKTEK